MFLESACNIERLQEHALFCTNDTLTSDSFCNEIRQDGHDARHRHQRTAMLTFQHHRQLHPFNALEDVRCLSCAFLPSSPRKLSVK